MASAKARSALGQSSRHRAASASGPGLCVRNHARKLPFRMPGGLPSRTLSASIFQRRIFVSPQPDGSPSWDLLPTLLGDMLLELKQPAAALREFEASQQREPNRFRNYLRSARRRDCRRPREGRGALPQAARAGTGRRHGPAGVRERPDTRTTLAAVPPAPRWQRSRRRWTRLTARALV